MKGLLSYFTFLLFISSNGWAQPPVNDNCVNAIFISTDSACVNGVSRLTGQSLGNATYEASSINFSSCGTGTSPDVWYRFVAKTGTPTITVAGLGSSWGTALRIQLLSGSCGSFTQIACVINAPLTVSTASALAPGTTYYIRIHKNNTSVPVGSNWGFTICITEPLVKGSRMGEVFSRSVLSGAGVLNYPWEVIYGPDNNLWVTESRGYRVHRINPFSGIRTTVLDISTGSTWLPSPADSLNAVNMGSWASWPQGGLAGMVLHPEFLTGAGRDFAYIAYIHRSLGGSSPTGIFYRNKLVRFTYNIAMNRFESPVVLCDTLPGSNDHNSQRLIIAPATSGGNPFLFYASGDMGAGQFNNRYRPNKSQLPESYEGKILRFNLEPDGDAGGNAWIPNDNPYGTSNAVWSIGIRNNQGFAYDPELHLLYGSSHGPYSDDEINIIRGFRNYGHPLVVGYTDGNYDGNSTRGTSSSISAGAHWNSCNIAGFTPPTPPFINTNSYCGQSTCPPIGSEVANVATINAGSTGQYAEPLFSAYAGPLTGSGSVSNIWATTTGANSNWPSEGWSGLDLYTGSLIPAWRKSLVAAGLKWGRLIRIKLATSGTITLPSNHPIQNAGDTIACFQSSNRCRDIAFAPNGRDIFMVMDNSSATSGPGVGNPTVPACPGCVVKYSFLGYEDAGGKSSIPSSVPVSPGTNNICNTATAITIDGSNNFLWVPITNQDGNIVAEINAMGQNMGAITTAFYKHSGTIRTIAGRPYLDRNITISPAINSFTIPVKVRLYITKAEYDALNAASSLINDIGDIRIYKNNDACLPALASAGSIISPVNTGVDLQHGTDAYVLQMEVTSFSSFYFGEQGFTLPVDLLAFNGRLQPANEVLLTWNVENERDITSYVVERSIDGNNFYRIGEVAAAGQVRSSYRYTDNALPVQSSLVFYYRLRINDMDGQLKYSSTITISMAGITGNITLTPNPFRTKTRVSVFALENGKITWSLTDNTGRVLLQGNETVKKGPDNMFTLDLSNFSAGIFYLHVSGAGITVQNSKLLKF